MEISLCLPSIRIPSNFIAFSPAAMNSFAVIDFTGEGKTDFMKTLTSRMKAHGMGLPINVAVSDILHDLTVMAPRDNNPQHVRNVSLFSASKFPMQH